MTPGVGEGVTQTPALLFCNAVRNIHSSLPRPHSQGTIHSLLLVKGFRPKGSAGRPGRKRNPPTLGRSVRPCMGERFTSPLPLSAWGSDPTCRKIHEKTRVIWQNRRFTRTLLGVSERLISIPRLYFCLRGRIFDALSA